MNRTESRAAVEAAAPGRVRYGVGLAPYSTFKVGGAAEILVEPETGEELGAVLRAVRAHDLPLFVLGGGTNLLIRDGGIPGVVVRMGRSFRIVEAQGTRVRAGTLAPMSKVAIAAERAGLVGIEFGFDIPGTVGGALTMNAGAHGGEIRNVLEVVHGYERDGTPRSIPVEEIEFSYRTARYPVDLVFTEAVFALVPGDRAELASRRETNHAYRLRTQPKGRTAGSVFKNPPGDHAGRLIEAAGFKGHRVGGAVVSTRHANWILNDQSACAGDIEGLIRTIQEGVRSRFGVELEPEVRIVGVELLPDIEPTCGGSAGGGWG